MFQINISCIFEINLTNAPFRGFGQKQPRLNFLIICFKIKTSCSNKLSLNPLHEKGWQISNLFLCK